MSLASIAGLCMWLQAMKHKNKNIPPVIPVSGWASVSYEHCCCGLTFLGVFDLNSWEALSCAAMIKINLPTWCMGDQNKDAHITFIDFNLCFQILPQRIITCITNKLTMSLYLYCMCRLAACLPCINTHESVESNFSLQISHFLANFDNNTCTFHFLYKREPSLT